MLYVVKWYRHPNRFYWGYGIDFVEGRQSILSGVIGCSYPDCRSVQCSVRGMEHVAVRTPNPVVDCETFKCQTTRVSHVGNESILVASRKPSGILRVVWNRCDLCRRVKIPA